MSLFRLPESRFSFVHLCKSRDYSMTKDVIRHFKVCYATAMSPNYSYVSNIMNVDYSKQWQIFKVRRAIFVLVFIGWFFIGTKLPPLINHLTQSQFGGLITLGVYLPVFFIAALRLINFKCPRCLKNYSSFSWMLGNKKCASCGLKKWAHDT